MSAQQALDVARDATSIARATVDPQDPIGRKPGQTVTVTPDDTGRDPVVGELVASDVHEIVIRRSDREIGKVCVHFPRAGFVVAAAKPVVRRTTTNGGKPDAAQTNGQPPGANPGGPAYSKSSLPRRGRI